MDVGTELSRQLDRRAAERILYRTRLHLVDLWHHTVCEPSYRDAVVEAIAEVDSCLSALRSHRRL